MTAKHKPGAEGIVQVFILFAVAGMAGAASFTHVHDWTMRNVPTGTGTWFGWANAIITELVPLACGLEVRRRKRQHHPAIYPMAILIIDAAVSLAIQLSGAIHTLAGSLAVALPALAFLALTKLILTRHPANEGSSWTSRTTLSGTAPSAATTASGSTTGSTALVPATGMTPATPAAPTSSPIQPPARDPFRDLKPVPSGQLIMSARMTAFAHQRETGQPITPEELADRLSVPLTLAQSLLDHSGTTGMPLVTAVNGTPHSDGAGQP